MVHGVSSLMKVDVKNHRKSVLEIHTIAVKMGSRRIFTPQFKIQVLDSYRNDTDCKGNQRATARKYGIHRRQIQKWLQCETNLRCSIVNSSSTNTGKTSLGIEHEVINIQSNANENNHHSTRQQSNADVSMLSLDVTRHSVASNSSTVKTCYPAHAQFNYAPVSFEHIPSTTGLPISAVFDTPMQHYGIRDISMHSNEHDYAPHHSTPNHQHQNYEIVANGNEYDSSFCSVISSTVTPIDLTVHTRRDEDGKNIDILSPCTCVLQHQSKDLKYIELSIANNKAWDLSCRKRTYNREDNNSPVTAPKVKLFKPYLLSNDEEEFNEEQCSTTKQSDPIIWSSYSSSTCSPCHYNDNYKSEYSQYANHKSTIPSLYEMNTNYNYSNNNSPFSGYDSASSSYSSSSECSELRANLQLDFTIQTADDYCNAISCKLRNEPLAGKHSDHCKEIQSWLLKDDEQKHNK